jgi:hypothetical protein
LPFEYRQLLSQHEQLDVFGEFAASAPDQQSQDSREGEIGKRKEHSPMLSPAATKGSKGVRRRSARRPRLPHLGPI